ncbi:MAG: Cof subfamily protein (haloacid dehalogenase superfamily) [Ilumatobacter sp.]|jgi:Cof subfamily protein (haloacid dehalogenase superfamily)
MNSNRRFNVVASDLDGTLFGPDHRLARRTISVLQRARNAGIIVIAATGRAPISAMDCLARYNVIDALICSNGSIVHDVATNTTVRRFPIEAHHMTELFTSLDAALPGLSFCWEMDGSNAWDPGFDDIARLHPDLRSFRIGERPDPSVQITKVMANHPEHHQEDLAERLLPHLPGPLTIGCSGVNFVEITGVGVDKSLALSHVVSELGFTASDVVAFGDNHNDLQMLQWAGHGVAVANAVDAAKSVADEVIGHHRDHSVADFIESLI